MAHPGGRPTKLTEELIEQAHAYVDRTKSIGTQEFLPTIEGLALELGIRRETVHAWANSGESPAEVDGSINPLHEEFSNIVDKLRAAQAQKLIQNSLLGRYNSTIAKLILSGKHGYVEQQSVDHTTKGKEMPAPILGGATSVPSDSSDT